MSRSQNVIVCPDCGAENLWGEVECVSCFVSLVQLDRSPDRQRKSSITLDCIGSLPLSLPSTVRHTDSVRQALEAFRDQIDGCLMVLGDEKLVGIVTERDILYKVAGGNLARDQRTVDDIMTPDPVRVHVTDSVGAAFHRMAVSGYRHLPVFDGERLVGVATMRTLLAYLHDHSS